MLNRVNWFSDGSTTRDELLLVPAGSYASRMPDVSYAANTESV